MRREQNLTGTAASEQTPGKKTGKKRKTRAGKKNSERKMGPLARERRSASDHQFRPQTLPLDGAARNSTVFHTVSIFFVLKNSQ